MRLLNMPSDMKGEVNDDFLKKQVTQLGLDYALATRWTSFVAVSRKVVNAHPESSQNANVPLHKVRGVTEKAYGESLSAQMAQIAQAKEFASSAAPEPAALSIMALMTLAGVATMRQRRRVAV